MNAEKRLLELGLQLPPAPEAKGVYRPLVVVGNLAYTSGHLPVDPAGGLADRPAWRGSGRAGRLPGRPTGRAGHPGHAAQGTRQPRSRPPRGQGARPGQLHARLHQQPAVVNGCSELFAEVFGPEAGIGARSAVGVGSLPLGVAVEIEAIFEIQ